MMLEIALFVFPFIVVWALLLSELLHCVNDAIGDYSLAKRYGNKDLKERRIIVFMLTVMVLLTAILPIFIFIFILCRQP